MSIRSDRAFRILLLLAAMTFPLALSATPAFAQAAPDVGAVKPTSCCRT